MAMNVFGNPITVSSLHGMVEYMNKKENEITRHDLAKVALDMKNGRENDINVFKYVRNVGRCCLKEQKEEEAAAVTLCVMYNATGDTLNYDSSHDWENGRIGHTPFPVTIANGQWAGFVHFSPSGVSKGAVVYRGIVDEEQTTVIPRLRRLERSNCIFVFTWDNPGGVRGLDTHSKAYAAAFKSNQYERAEIWNISDNFLDQQGALVNVHKSSNGCVSSVSIGDVGRGAIAEAIFTIEADAHI